jgi:hypothetical protein
MRKSVVITAAVSVMLAAGGPAWGAGPIVVKASISPGFVYFADVVTARVDVFFDPADIVPSSVRVNPSFGSWGTLGSVRASSANSATLDRRTWSFTLTCVIVACLPRGTDVQSFLLPPLTVSARTVHGSARDVHRGWPPVQVAGRFLPPANGNVRPQLRLQTAPPRASYRVDPTWLAFVLDIGGVLVIGSALVLLVREIALRWAAALNEIDDRSPLSRALILVRQAQRRDIEDRRRAAGLLARTLPRGSPALSDAASELAWSATQPSPGSLEVLARAVEADMDTPP